MTATATTAHVAHVRTFTFAVAYRVHCTCDYVSEFTYTEHAADTIRDEHMAAHA